MDTVEERLIAQVSAVPHWLVDGNTFWYLHSATAERSQFILVEVLKKTRRLVFDHRQLAITLQRQTDIEINHEALPFTWIDIQPDADSTHFRFAGKMWQYGPGNFLKEGRRGGIESDVRLLRKEVPSVHSSSKVSVQIVNRSSTPLQLFWIDWDGNAVLDSAVEIGATRRYATYVGHVWRLVDETSGKVKAIYSAPEQREDVFIVEDGEIEVLDVDVKSETKSKPGNKPDELAEANEEPVYTSKTARDSDDGTDDCDNPKRQVVVSDNNLWLKEPDGCSFQLTSNGSEENKYDDTKLFLSPDERFAVAWQYTAEQDHIINIVESSPSDQLQPKLKSIQYLKPGDRVRVDRPRLFDLNNRSEIPTDDSLFANPYSLYDIGWSKDSAGYRFIFNERGHQHVRVLSFQRDGLVRVVVDESSETFLDYSSKMDWHILKDTDELIWASERDGYNHLHLIDLAKGTVKSQITQGQWNVASVDHVDEDQRKVWLKSYGAVKDQDPYYAHLIRVNLDGSGLRILTDGDGTHTWKWSPDRRYLIDTWSRVDFPPQMILRDAESGKEIMYLEGSTFDDLQRESWNAPERFVAPGRDGKTLIYGIIIRPPTFDESKVYPILEDIYAGPHHFFTPKAFSTLTKQRQWAKQGFVVVKLDGMGTNWRSKTFHDVCYKNLDDAGLPDRIAWIKAAASSRHWMDLSRVGIFGGSAGGQNAAAAILHHGDFYKAGAADCGCHDNRLDKLWWNEQWMGYPVDESYTKSSNVTHAAKLHGALMLIVGELDTNVDPASTMQMVHALNEAGKDYELLFIPGGKHCAGRSEYGVLRQQAFFRRHLRPL